MEQTRQASSWRTLARAWRIAWPIIRQVIGWISILVGIIGLVLPMLPGVVFLVIGIVLVGRRNWLIRKASVSWKLFLRRWAAVQTPLIGPVGRMALRGQQRVSWQRRRLHWWYEERRRQRAALRAEHVPDDSP